MDWRIESLRGLRLAGFRGPKVIGAAFPAAARGFVPFLLMRLEGDCDLEDIGRVLFTECVDVDDPEVEDPDVIK